jgi:hypothetical protein
MGFIFGDSPSNPYGKQPPLESDRWDAQYDPETAEPLNEAAVKAEKEFDEWAMSQDSDTIKAIENLGKKLATPEIKPLAQSGRMSSPSLREGSRRGFRGFESPYQTPTYLASSVDYNKAVNQLVSGLLKQNIRRTKLSTLV